MSNYPDNINLDHPTLSGSDEPNEAGYCIYQEDLDLWIGHPKHSRKESEQQPFENIADAIECAKGASALACGIFEENHAACDVLLILDSGESAVDQYEEIKQIEVLFDSQKMKFTQEQAEE